VEDVSDEGSPGVAVALLALVGAAELVSEVVRDTLVQRAIPERRRGPLTFASPAQANGAPAPGYLEAGAVASLTTPAISVISGDLGCTRPRLSNWWRGSAPG